MSITEFSASGSRFTDVDLRRVQEGCSQISSLILQQMVVSERAYEVIGRFRNLTELTLAPTNPPSYEMLDPLTTLPSLATIWLSEDERFASHVFNDDALRFLGRCLALRKVDLFDLVDITDRTILTLGRLPQLQSLHVVQSPRITGARFNELAGFGALQKLFLQSVHGLSGRGLLLFVEHCVNLTDLEVIELRMDDSRREFNRGKERAIALVQERVAREAALPAPAPANANANANAHANASAAASATATATLYKPNSKK